MPISVLILSQYVMFGLGLESLLNRETGLQVVGLETEPEQASKAIRELHPDVVILYADDSIASSEMLLMVLKLTPDTKVIHLNLQNNVFYVYQVTHRIVKDLGDLVDAAQNMSISARGRESDTQSSNRQISS